VIGTLDILGIPILLAHPERELCPLDEDVNKLAAIARQHRADLKTVMGITIAKNASVATVLKRFLEVLGIDLRPLSCRRVEGKSVRFYQLVVPQDGREQIFQQWQLQDRQTAGSSEVWLEEYWLRLQSPLPAPAIVKPYQQLSLSLES